MKQIVMNIINLLLKLLRIDTNNSSIPVGTIKPEPDIEQPEAPNEPVPSIQEVIDELEEMLDKFMDKTHNSISYDPRAVFTFTYQQITKTIQDGLDNQIFEHPRWMADLDKRFADYYFEAVNDFDLKRPPKSEVWVEAFKAIGAGSKKTSQTDAFTVLKAKVIPMIAHMTHDLPVALSDLKADATHRKDHETINRLLIEKIGDVQEGKQIFGVGIQELDDFGGELDEWLMGKIIPRLRDQAWHDAQNLQPDGKIDKEKIEENTLELIQKFSGIDKYGTFGESLLILEYLLNLPNVTDFWSNIFERLDSLLSS